MSDMDAFNLAYLSETQLKIAIFLVITPIILMAISLIFDIVNQNNRKDI